MAETNKMAEVVVGAGAAESGVMEPAAAGAPRRRRTKLVRVQQRYIDCLLKRTPMGPFPTLRDVHATPEERERFRRFYDETTALVKKVRDKEDAILEQYRTYGFAMQEVEVRDDDE